MNFAEAEQYIHSFTRFGSQLGLERMAELLRRIGNPQDQLHFVHIAGTNGKGSTAKMTSTILKEAGYTVGMYISPFVVDFRERFQVNNHMIEKSEFSALVEFIDPYVKELASEGQQVTEFEVITAIAFEFFRRRKCDIVALEVGLGGRFDATNVIRTPDCAVICSISLDHTDILGDTIAEIAFEKAGIIKENTDVVTYPLQEPEALAVFLEQCQKSNSRLIQPNPGAIEILESGVLGSRFVYDGRTYKLRLAGKHQIYNAAAVIETMKVLRKKGFSVSDNAIYQGIKKAAFPARFEIMSRHPLIIVDGAHNRQAAASLAQTLDKLEASPKIAVMGMMADKDYRSAVASIGSKCEEIITIPVPCNPRAVDPVLLAEAAGPYCKTVATIPDYDVALETALSRAGEKGAVIICGSFYMASDMRKTVKKWLAARKPV